MSVSDIYRALSPASLSPVAPESRPKSDLPRSDFKSEFKAVLDKELNLSQHAQARIQSRLIPWDAAMEKRITSGIEAARAKGSREALILADNVAVIANIKSNTVITAMDRTQMKDKIFTNIDSAVIV